MRVSEGNGCLGVAARGGGAATTRTHFWGLQTGTDGGARSTAVAIAEAVERGGVGRGGANFAFLEHPNPISNQF